MSHLLVFVNKTQSLVYSASKRYHPVDKRFLDYMQSKPTDPTLSELLH